MCSAQMALLADDYIGDVPTAGVRAYSRRCCAGQGDVMPAVQERMRSLVPKCVAVELVDSRPVGC